MKNDLLKQIASIGFDNIEIIWGSQVICDPIFRKQCESNACGVFGKCWMCPPHVGEINALIAEVKKYDKALLYQSIFTLEDSFDFEGMQEGGKKHGERSIKLNDILKNAGVKDFLHLTKGGCGVCQRCAINDNEPCRFPEKALSSLEAYGVNVSATVKSTSMKYINGPDTVTYFGIVLFKENDLCLK